MIDSEFSRNSIVNLVGFIDDVVCKEDTLYLTLKIGSINKDNGQKHTYLKHDNMIPCMLSCEDRKNIRYKSCNSSENLQKGQLIRVKGIVTYSLEGIILGDRRIVSIMNYNTLDGKKFLLSPLKRNQPKRLTQ